MAEKDKPSLEYTDLDKLLARAKDFEAGGHLYKVLPLLIKDALELAAEYPWYYNPVWLVTEGEGRDLLMKWVDKAVRTVKGDAVTFDIIEADGWTTADITDCLKAIGGVSG
jgi:hypothetical protein